MASARSATCSLAKMLDTWLRTVFGLSDSAAEDCLTTGYCSDRTHDVRLIGALEDVARGYCPHRSED